MAKDNAVNDESLVKTVQQSFYMNDFLKTVRTSQEAIEIYQKIRDVLIKGVFKLTKWITSDDEVKSQIPETERSTKVVKTFEAEPQSSSILGLNWNVDRDSLLVCRGTEQEVPAKIPENCPILCLSSVGPTWDMFTLHDTTAFPTQKQLGSNGTSMGQKVVSRTLATVQ